MTTLALSGWTQSPDALLNIAPDALTMDYAHLRGLDAVADALPVREVDVVVGWSLGGLIARELLRLGALKARRLVMIASPFQFVSDARFEAGMPPDTHAQFRANYRDDTERTIRRFAGLLAHGDAHSEKILDALMPHTTIAQPDVWLPWLDALSAHSAADHDYGALPPSLIIHGRGDAVVRYPQAEALAAHLPNATLLPMDQAGHAPHWHDEQAVAAAIGGFVNG